MLQVKSEDLARNSFIRTFLKSEYAFPIRTVLKREVVLFQFLVSDLNRAHEQIDALYRAAISHSDSPETGVGTCPIRTVLKPEFVLFQVVISDLDRAHEQIDHAISSALLNSKPVYISVCCNLAGVPHPSFAFGELSVFGILGKGSGASSFAMSQFEVFFVIIYRHPGAGFGDRWASNCAASSVPKTKLLVSDCDS
jgi:hypothetical protein